MRGWRFLGALWLGVFLAGLPSTGEAQPDTGQLRVCLWEAADLSPVYPTTTLPPTKTLAAVFRVSKGQYKKLTSRWIAIDVGTFAPPNSLVSTRNLLLAKDGDRGMFRIEARDMVPRGKYRLEVLADDKPWKSVDFTAPGADGVAKLAGPQDLLSLVPGRTWTYAFSVEFENGQKKEATMTYTVGKVEASGSHIEIRLDGRPHDEMWWQVGEPGLAVTQRGKMSEALLEQPQTWWPWPLKPPQTWRYDATDKSFTQTYRMWGPVPVKGPNGEVPGYVVMTERLMPRSDFQSTTERHFLPGVGMVREIYITATRGAIMRNRQELVLKDVK